MVTGAGDLVSAAVAYQDCLRIEPGHQGARSHLASVMAESERRNQRDQTIRTIYRSAMEAFGAGDLEVARDQFAEALVLAPEDADMRELAQRVDDAIRMREEVAAAQAEAKGAVERAEAAALASVPGKTPGDLVKDDRVESSAKEIAESVTDAKPSYASLSEARRREIAELYQQGVQAAAFGRRDDAVRYWELVANAAPDYQQVADHLKQEYLARGMEAFAEGRLDRAIEIWEQALEVGPDDQRTQGYLERAHEHRVRLSKITNGE